MESSPDSQTCPLCHQGNIPEFHSVSQKNLCRSYFLCPSCDMISVPKRDHPDREAEKKRYQTHNNDPNDPGYRKFLNRLWEPMKAFVPEKSKGLDFGSGPGPTMSLLMEESGFEVAIYDPFFAPHREALESEYGFISCSETAEHFSDPAREFDLLDRLLQPGGVLGVMTGILPDWKDFPGWYYHRDETHISFYSRKTMEWVGGRYGWEVRFPGDNVILFLKPGSETGPE